MRASQSVSTMSSETSTKRVRPQAADAASEAQLQSGRQPDAGLQPWQFFVLAGLGCATAVIFMVRGQGVTPIVLLTVLMASAALVGMAALRMLRPLVSAEDDRTVMIGQRTRAALEREKFLSLRAIKELEFDHAMGKVSDEDWKEMSGRLRARASGLIRQLDAGAGYRDQIERDLARRLGDGDGRPDAGPGARLPPPRSISADGPSATDDRSATSVEHHCGSCSTINDADAKFCKNCGARL
jgi:hypothetical protein